MILKNLYITNKRYDLLNVRSMVCLSVRNLKKNFSDLFAWYIVFYKNKGGEIKWEGGEIYG